MSESRQTHVTLHDIDPQALEQLVQYAYTAEIVVGEGNVQVGAPPDLSIPQSLTSGALLSPCSGLSAVALWWCLHLTVVICSPELLQLLWMGVLLKALLQWPFPSPVGGHGCLSWLLNSIL